MTRKRKYQLPRPLGRWASNLLAGLALVFLTLPILALAGRALTQGGWENLFESNVISAVVLSAITTAITTTAIALFGTPLAYWLARGKFRYKRWLNIFIELPIVLPPAVAGLALLITFGRRGVLGGVLTFFGISLPFTTAAVVLAQAFVAAPFYIRAAQLGFASIAPEVLDAARVDGAEGWDLVRYVMLPLAARALGAGLILAWARAAGEFGATILFAGSLQGRTQTMPLLIYNIIERDLDAAIWTGLVLIVLAAVALLFSRWLEQEADR